jgi:exopolyphosphatase/guanosine-5'-triphosphate,3'-diphosphate pyrophosphatase
MLRALLFIFICLPLSAKNCIQRRGAFDIGSGSTKIVVADVNTCKGTIDKILYEDSMKLEYEKSLENNKGFFHKLDMLKGKLIIMGMLSKAKALGCNHFAGVATAAFRKAKNAKPFLQSLSSLNLPVSIIDSSLEGRLAWFGAISKLRDIPAHLLTWDIGGGSMQMTAMSNNRLITWSSTIASISFKNLVIQKLLGKDPRIQQSPNPIQAATLLSSIEFVSEQTDNIPLPIKRILSQPDATVLGLGGVHYYSIRTQTGAENFYTPEMVYETLMRRANLTDNQIGGPYASTEITNLALVYGIMKTMNIQNVIPVKVNLAHGLLLNPDCWEQ